MHMSGMYPGGHTCIHAGTLACMHAYTHLRMQACTRTPPPHTHHTNTPRDVSRGQERANPAIFEGVGVGAFSRSQCATVAHLP